MYQINDDNSIYVTRGDVAVITVSATNKDGSEYLFKQGDVVRIKVFGKKDAERVVLQKDFPVLTESKTVTLYLDENDTKIGEVISKPVDYWYEVELNPLSDPRTIIGYDEDGAKVFKLFPEGRDLEEYEYTEEDIPLVDDELDLASSRPVENQAVARAVERLKWSADSNAKEINSLKASTASDKAELENEIAVERARINSFTKLAEGSTTGDAELQDIRVGADGKTYSTAGTSVRNQFSKVTQTNTEHTERLTEIENAMGVIPKVAFDGYLTVVDGEMTYKGEGANKGIHTRKIACVEGQVFEYKGVGRHSAPSVIWFNNDTILSTEMYESETDFTEVTAPNGANFVIFASFCLFGESLVFELNVPTKENVIAKLKAEVENTPKLYMENLYNYERTEEGYLNASGVIVAGAYRTSEYIPVNKGDVLTVSNCRTINLFNLDKKSYYYDNANITDPRTVTVTRNGFIRVSFRDTVYTTGMIVMGDTLPSVYVAYLNRLDEGVWFSKKQEEHIDNVGYQSNSLYGKKYVACGDSFTAGDFTNSPTNDYTFMDGEYAGCYKVYPYYIGRRNKMTVINEAICGSTLTNGGANPLSADRLYAIPLDVDYVTIKIGINDDGSHQDMPIGTIDDTTNTTFYGAWNVVLNYLTTNLPYAKIGIIVTNGAKQNIVDATIASAKKWGIPYINLATDDKLPVMLRTLRTDVCADAKDKRNKAFSVAWDGGNRHPNAKAHEFESYIIENWLRSI